MKIGCLVLVLALGHAFPDTRSILTTHKTHTFEPIANSTSTSHETQPTTTTDHPAEAHDTNADVAHDDGHNTGHEDATAHDDGQASHDDGHASHDDGSHDGGHGGGHHEFEMYKEKEAFYLLLFLIILLTLCFESLEHKITHTVPDPLQPVWKALLSELTVLGFIGVVALLVTEDLSESTPSLMGLLSQIIFADKEHLIHRFHEVHFEIFFVMIAFIFVVTVYVLITNMIEKEYETFEKDCHKLYALKEKEKDQKDKGQKDKDPHPPKHARKPSVWSALFFSSTSQAEHQVLRDRFVSTCKLLKTNAQAQTDEHVLWFNFGKYRSQMVIKTVVLLLHMGVFDWLFVLVVVFFFVALYDPSSAIVSAIVFAAFAMAILLFVFAWYKKCCSIKEQLLPVKKEDLPKMQDKALVPICDAEDPSCPPYRTNNITAREGISKHFYKVPANRQEKLFWGQNKHRSVMFGQLRTCSLLTVVEIACAVSVGSKTIFSLSAVLGVAIFAVYLATIYMIARCIQEYSLITSIEKMKDNAVVAKVLHEEEAKMRQQVTRLMDLLATFLDKEADRDEKKGEKAGKSTHAAKDLHKELSELQENETKARKDVEEKLAELPKVIGDLSKVAKLTGELEVLTSAHAELQKDILRVLGEIAQPAHDEHAKQRLIRRFKDFLNVSPSGEYASMNLSYNVVEALMRDTPEWSDYLTEKQYAEHIALMDLNGDKEINEEEFVNHTLKAGGSSKLTRALEVVDGIYRRYDQDGNGLSLEELKTAIKEVAKDVDSRFPEMNIIFDRMDTTGDGVVMKSEFIDFVKPLFGGKSQKHGH